MASTLVINKTDYETRVAVMENGKLAELYIERDTDDVQVGNIYKGKVIKVLPGMESAFVDIGTDHAAFLSVSDVRFDKNIDIEKKKKKNISSLLKKNQHIVVQVLKEAIGTKGPRVTTNVTLSGRHLVLMPTTPGVGVSKKIENSVERDRLKKILNDLYGINNYGLIARTVSSGVHTKVLKQDYDFLVRKWNEIMRKKNKESLKGLMHTEMDVSLRVLRDVLSGDVKKIIIDDKDAKDELVGYLAQHSPGSKRLVEIYRGKDGIFEHYGVDRELARAMEKRIWLKSGGYIIVDYAEAAVVIDVNTGKYVGSKNLEETVLNTNIEAAKEIAYQLRLQNLGGIIIIDFIDMDKQPNKEKVLSALNEELKKDKAKTNVIAISELGLVEMTRQRTRNSIVKTICQPCPFCAGRGYSKSYKTVAYEVFREVEKCFVNEKVKKVVVHLNPDLIAYISQNENKLVEQVKKRHGKELFFELDSKLRHEQYKVSLGS
ncbi:MAG: Rne/Rng family ribonuclease [Pseudomonadota bacterium]